MEVEVAKGVVVEGDEAAEDEDDDEEADKPEEELPQGALVLSLVDDEDEVPVYSSAITGATADPVKDYLKQIGKVALLNAGRGGRARDAHRGPACSRRTSCRN
ncbi:MAG: hypothetical protein WDM88_04245 [Galbitalea sp.]